MRKLRDLGSRLEFLEAGGTAREQMEAGLLRAEIDRVYVEWGLEAVEGLTIDGEPAGAYTRIASRPVVDFRAIDAALLIPKETA